MSDKKKQDESLSVQYYENSDFEKIWKNNWLKDFIN
jgi:hypothetical protein